MVSTRKDNAQLVELDSSGKNQKIVRHAQPAGPIMAPPPNVPAPVVPAPAIPAPVPPSPTDQEVRGPGGTPWQATRVIGAEIDPSLSRKTQLARTIRQWKKVLEWHETKHEDPAAAATIRATYIGLKREFQQLKNAADPRDEEPKWVSLVVTLLSEADHCTIWNSDVTNCRHLGGTKKRSRRRRATSEWRISGAS